MKRSFWALSSLIFVFLACSKSDDDDGGGGGGNNTLDCGTVSKSFANDVSPIFAGTCAAPACHNAGSFNGPGALTNYTSIFANRVAIRAAVANGSMPKNSSLSTNQKNAILCWIDGGAANN